jgi:transcriptional regulator of acetoin/glycerol metabolism
MTHAAQCLMASSGHLDWRAPSKIIGERLDFDWLLDKLLNADLGGSGQLVRIDPQARAVLRSYQWPGNILQLLNALEFAKAFCSGGIIGAAALPDYVGQDIGSTAGGGRVLPERPFTVE